MWLRFLRSGLFTVLLAVPLSAVMPHTASLYADDSGSPNHCRSDAVAYSYYYADGSQDSAAGDLLDTYDYSDFSSCLTASQQLAINVAGRSCVGVSYGTYGIAYSQVLWDVFWNDEYRGTVGPQQYDCGDVSVY